MAERRGTSAARGRSRSRAIRSERARRRRRRRLIAPAGLVLSVVVLALFMTGAFTSSRRGFISPSRASLSHMSLRQRIVAIASSQIGYRTHPSRSYCNKFSAYWDAGSRSCPGRESAEEWCADFAAWAWQRAGVPVRYGFEPGEVNAGAASFYEYGVAHGTWHSFASGYRAAPGDVAVYGLALGVTPTAAHVAIVTGDPSGRRGPDVINGDGDRTGFSVVDQGTDQLRADTGQGKGAPLSGYVSPE